LCYRIFQLSVMGILVDAVTRNCPGTSDRYDAREPVDLLDGVGRHDQVAVVRLERWLRSRGCDGAADRVA
jgi:hypothetical protein